MRFDKEKHSLLLSNLVKEIYKKPSLAATLGFKDGTAAMLFYDLPRGSVDLDFDLLDESKKDKVFKEIKDLADKFGKNLEAVEKRRTLFFLISYEKGAKKIKIEISKRLGKSEFEVRSFLGISVKVMEKNSMLSNKLCALISRRYLAARNLFDTWFFLKNGWEFCPEVVKGNLGVELSEALKKAILFVEKVTRNQILYGLGEFIDDKDKNWLKDNLKDELLFQLKLAAKNVRKEV